MRWSQTLIPTQKETPADAQIISHQLMVRAGFIRQVSAGVFDFLPLGVRSLRKAAKIVREEMDAIGGAEVLLPALQPLELWQQTGRDVGYGENLFSPERSSRPIERAGADARGSDHRARPRVRRFVQAVAAALYQIQTKFRDEYRPRFGLCACASS